jgi:hypothetical protein
VADLVDDARRLLRERVDAYDVDVAESSVAGEEYQATVLPRGGGAPLRIYAERDFLVVEVGSGLRYELAESGSRHDGALAALDEILSAVTGGGVTEVFLPRHVSAGGWVGPPRRRSVTPLTPVGLLVGRRRRYPPYEARTG